MAGKVISINISKRKGIGKGPIPEGHFVIDCGLVGDAHSGKGDRQVSLLAWESVVRQEEKLSREDLNECSKVTMQGASLKPGDFAENITASGIDLAKLPVGARLHVGDELKLEITRIGKECHRYCTIFKRLGDCVMPREGVFARVIRDGTVHPGDRIMVEKAQRHKEK